MNKKVTTANVKQEATIVSLKKVCVTLTFCITWGKMSSHLVIQNVAAPEVCTYCEFVVLYLPINIHRWLTNNTK